MNMKHALALLTLIPLAGCAHSTMRGSVAMKASDEEAHVCMGDQEVKAGDRVALFKNVCTAPKGRGGRAGDGGDTVAGCKKVKLGEGTVEQAFNEHYSAVKVDSGVSFAEGNIVEKL